MKLEKNFGLTKKRQDGSFQKLHNIMLQFHRHDSIYRQFLYSIRKTVYLRRPDGFLQPCT